jgi:hypothetical protein
MKRIAITVAALAISTTAFAGVSENYGSVFSDPVASSSSYNTPDTNLQNHGSVLLDGVTNNRGLPRTIERGLDHEISVGGADTIFGANPDENF